MAAEAIGYAKALSGEAAGVIASIAKMHAVTAKQLPVVGLLGATITTQNNRRDAREWFPPQTCASSSVTGTGAVSMSSTGQ